MKSSFKWLAVLVSVIVGMFIGFLWYGAFFNGAWSEAVGFTGPGLTEAGAEVLKYGQPVTLDPVTPMIINVGLMTLYAVFFGWLTGRTEDTTFGEGAMLGAVVGVVAAAGQAVGNLFAMEPTVLSLIDGSYYIVLFAVIGGIMGGWRNRIS